jgi:hypothetical protein
MHRKLIASVVAIGALVIPAIAAATSSQPAYRTEAHVSANSGPNAFDPATCKFLHRERDVVTNIGSIQQKVAQNGRYDIAEDARHDAKMNCLTNLVNTLKKKIGSPATLLYKTAFATGTGERVTATCPAGYFVTGGGSHSETAGSYEEGSDAWTVVRDHLSPRVLDVTAICIQVS